MEEVKVVPLAFIPPPLYEGVLVAQTAEPAGELTLRGEHFTLRRGRKVTTLDLSERFGAMLSHSEVEGSPEEVWLHLELRQQQARGWARIGLTSRARTLGAGVRDTVMMRRSFARLSEREMLQVLGRVHGAMLVQGEVRWGLEGLSSAGAMPQGDAAGVMAHFRPKHIQIGVEDETLVVRQHWFLGKGAYLFPLWVLFCATVVLSGALIGASGSPYVGHLALSLGVVVAALAWTGLRQTLRVDSHMLRVLRFWGFWEPAYARHRIDQLYCVENQPNALRYAMTFSVKAQLRDLPAPVTLLSGLATAEEALFIEKSVERYLGIEDLPVDGEIALPVRPLSG